MFLNRTTKPFIFGAAIATIITAGVLDNRFGAIVKAFNAPEAVNAAQFKQVVEVKK